MARLFVSHASKDKAIVDAFVELLQVGVGIDPKDIFCSSVTGMDIPTGEDFVEYIKDAIQNPELVLLMLSPEFLKSSFCHNELGASWAKSLSLYPILIPPLEFDKIPTIIAGKQAAKLDNKEKLNELRDRLATAFQLTPFATNKWEGKRDKFLTHFVTRAGPGVTESVPSKLKPSSPNRFSIKAGLVLLVIQTAFLICAAWTNQFPFLRRSDPASQDSTQDHAKAPMGVSASDATPTNEESSGDRENEVEAAQKTVAIDESHDNAGGEKPIADGADPAHSTAGAVDSEAIRLANGISITDVQFDGSDDKIINLNVTLHNNSTMPVVVDRLSYKVARIWCFRAPDKRLSETEDDGPSGSRRATPPIELWGSLMWTPCHISVDRRLTGFEFIQQIGSTLSGGSDYRVAVKLNLSSINGFLARAHLDGGECMYLIEVRESIEGKESGVLQQMLYLKPGSILTKKNNPYLELEINRAILSEMRILKAEESPEVKKLFRGIDEVDRK